MRAMRRVGSHLKNSKMICKSDWAASAAEVRIYNPATSFDGRIVPEVVRCFENDPGRIQGLARLRFIGNDTRAFAYDCAE